jgi:GH18 family chitinase
MQLLIKKKTDALPYIQRANAKGVKTWMQIGSYSNDDLGPKDFSEMAADPAKRKTLISWINGTLDKYDLDGVYVFWRYPGCPVAF